MGRHLLRKKVCQSISVMKTNTAVIVVFKTKRELKCQFSGNMSAFVFITEILWRTFWRNKWRSVFVVVKDSSYWNLLMVLLSMPHKYLPCPDSIESVPFCKNRPGKCTVWPKSFMVLKIYLNKNVFGWIITLICPLLPLSLGYILFSILTYFLEK